MNEEKNKTIKEKILSQIKSGELSMKPKWHFLLKAILAWFGGIILALSLLYLVSFILFIMRQSGIIFAPNFGFRGVMIFLLSLPWILIFLTLGFVLVLEILVRYYAFSYRQPILYSLIGILLFVVIGGLIVGETDLHKGMFKYASDDKLPIFGPIYKVYGKQKIMNIYPGIIEEITEDGFKIIDPDDNYFQVLVDEFTKIPLEIEFEIGNKIFIFGDKDGEEIKAFGIKDGDDLLIFGRGKEMGAGVMMSPKLMRVK